MLCYAPPVLTAEREVTELLLSDSETRLENPIALDRTPTALAPRTPPPGWTWHHEVEPGVLRLVPREQHTPGSAFWDLLHQGGRGGYSIWGQR